MASTASGPSIARPPGAAVLDEESDPAAVSVHLTMQFAAMAPRIITAIGIAAGHTATGAVDALLPFLLHNSKLPLEKVLYYHQYVYRLLGYYEEKGCPLNISAYCGLALQTPPSLSSAEIIMEALMMAEQGVKNFTFLYGAQGNLIQDVASARVCLRILQEYLDRFSYKDVALTLSFHNASYTRLPDDTARSFAVLSQHTLAAVLAGAQICNPRGTTEGKFIAGKQALADSLKCAKTIIDMFKPQKIELDKKALEVEADMFEREVRAIANAIIELGDGDVVMGVIKAVESGVIDHPFGTHPSIACKVMGVRDAQGAVRWFDYGNLPFGKDIIEFHKEKIAERERKRGREIDFDTLVDDIVALSEGSLVLPE